MREQYGTNFLLYKQPKYRIHLKWPTYLHIYREWVRDNMSIPMVNGCAHLELSIWNISCVAKGFIPKVKKNCIHSNNCLLANQYAGDDIQSWSPWSPCLCFHCLNVSTDNATQLLFQLGRGNDIHCLSYQQFQSKVMQNLLYFRPWISFATRDLAHLILVLCKYQYIKYVMERLV